jgi:hypothetical protein
MENTNDAVVYETEMFFQSVLQRDPLWMREQIRTVEREAESLEADSMYSSYPLPVAEWNTICYSMGIDARSIFEEILAALNDVLLHGGNEESRSYKLASTMGRLFNYMREYDLFKIPPY